METISNNLNFKILILKISNQRLCYTHASLAKCKTDSKKFIDWQGNDKQFNEIVNSLKNKNDYEKYDEEITENLVEIDSEPEYLNFSNDSSEQLMLQIIKQHSSLYLLN